MTNEVEKLEQLDGLGHALAVLSGHLDGDTLLKSDVELVWLIGGIGRVDSHLPQMLGGLMVGVLEDTSFVAAVYKVLVHAPWSLGGRGDGDVVDTGILEEIISALEFLNEDGVSPRSDDLD